MSLNYNDILEDESPRFNYSIPPKEQPHPKNWFGNRSKLNSPDVYEYKNINNETCFYVERKEVGNDKIFYHYSFDIDKNSWVQKAWPDNRPLFREQYLTKNSKPILLVEGEKCVKFCENNTFIKEHYLPMTWSGGGYAVSKTNFQHLKNRQVVLFPDNDEPGRLAMHEIAFNLIKNKIIEKDIKFVTIPKEISLPESWDLADQFPKGYNVENFLTPGSIFLKNYNPKENKKIWEDLEQKVIEKEIKVKQKEIVNKYVYVSDRDDFRDTEKNIYLDIKRMDHWHLVLTKRGESMSKRLLKDPKLKKVYRVICHAGLSSGVVKVADEFSEVKPGIYYNTYIKPNIISKLGDVSVIANYYEWLFGKENWNVIAKFIHVLIKHGGRKINWVPVLISQVEGAGKGLLASLIKSLLGYSNVLTNVSVEQLVEKHSTVIEDRQLICLNELSFTGYKADKREVSNRLKSIFADPFIVINPKNKPNYETPNICNFMVNSNDDRCLHLEQSSRRYFIINIKHDREQIIKKLNNSDVLKTILETIKGGEQLSFLLNYFENIELPDYLEFIQRAPASSDLQDMIESSKDDIHKYLDHSFESGNGPFWQVHQEDFSGMINVFNLMHNLRGINKGEMETVPKHSQHQIETWLKSKCTRWPNGEWSKTIKSENGRIRVWLIKDKKFNGKYISEMTENEAGLIYGLNRHFPTPSDKQKWIDKFNGKQEQHSFY